MLKTFAANPDLARFTLMAPPNAGGEIASRYRELLERLFARLTAGKPSPPAVQEPSRAVTDGLLGGIVALVVRKVRADEGEQLPELLPPCSSSSSRPTTGARRHCSSAAPAS